MGRLPFDRGVSVVPTGLGRWEQRWPRVSSAVADFTLGYFRFSLRETEGHYCRRAGCCL